MHTLFGVAFVQLAKALSIASSTVLPDPTDQATPVEMTTTLGKGKAARYPPIARLNWGLNGIVHASNLLPGALTNISGCAGHAPSGPRASLPSMPTMMQGALEENSHSS